MDYLVKTTDFAAPVDHKVSDTTCLGALTKTLFAALAFTVALLSSGSSANAANVASSALAGNPADGYFRDRLLKLGNSQLATTNRTTTGTNLCYSSCSPSQSLSNTCVSADALRDVQDRANNTPRLSMGKHGFYASLMAQN